MSLRIALLGMLTAEGPSSGYDLTKLFEKGINQAWQAKHSQIYPELAKLARDGVVTVESAGGGRGRKTYAITAEGRAEMYEWLTGREPNRTSRNEMSLRAFMIPLLPPAEAAAMLRVETAYYAAELARLETMWAKICAMPVRPNGRYALDRGIRQVRALKEWAEDTVADLERQAPG